MIANPTLRDEIINVDESPDKETKKAGAKKQNHTGKRARRLTKAESLRIFASILDFI